MAKIVKSKTQLEKNYRFVRNTTYFWGLMIFISIGLFTNNKNPLFIILFFVSLTATSIYKKKANILASGVHGEKDTLKIIQKLPNDYQLFNGVEFTLNDQFYELDALVCGPNGVFIIEVKNHKGTIEGNIEDLEWKQTKIGRGGTVYTSTLSNPIKQVNRHIYGFSNYLKKQNHAVWVQGILFFSNPSAIVKVNHASNEVPIFTINDSDDLCQFIVNYKGNEVPKSVLQKLDKLFTI